MTISAFPPGLILIFGALLIPILGGRFKPFVTLTLPLLALALVWHLPEGASSVFSVLDYSLTLVNNDVLSRLFATIFAIMLFAGTLFALNQKRNLEIVAAFICAGSAISIVQAGDLITLFIFWEIMALASTLLVLSVGGKGIYKVSMRYLLVHLLGGTLFMAGIVIQISESGTTAFTAMQPDSWGTGLILAGFLVNAAAPPLSAWLSDAYPKASWSGMVFLSAFTTKSAVYVLLRGFPGAEILVGVGVFMIFYGIVYALLENDMRRILAYSIVNQVGFMVAGVGIGTEMALNGAAAHAFAHIIYKALLLMSAGSVLYMTGKRKCTDLGGLFRTMPLTTICCIVGALSISSFPLTSGFISKSMIAQAAVNEQLGGLWFLLLAASAGVFLHAGIKFPWLVFFQKDSGLRPPDPPWNMRLAMILFAVLCIGLGIWPELLYGLLPFPTAYQPYTVPHVVNSLQLLLFSGLAFFMMLPVMARTLTLTLDVDWIYRRLAPKVGAIVGKGLAAMGRNVSHLAKSAVGKVGRTVEKAQGPDSPLVRNWPSGAMVLLVVALLGALLIYAFL